MEYPGTGSLVESSRDYPANPYTISFQTKPADFETVSRHSLPAYKQTVGKLPRGRSRAQMELSLKAPMMRG